MSSPKPVYKRILLKLSGESLAGDQKTGISPSALQYFVHEIKKAHMLGIEIGLVLGGGNLFRGLSEQAARMERTTADQMGMLATVINSLALKDTLVQAGIPARVLTATQMNAFADYYISDKAEQYLSRGEVILIAGGTGNPYFTTDTAAVLRAVEIKADVVIKGTRVDGVYNADPEKVEDAVKFDRLSYMEVIKRGLKVMDITAITLAMDNQLPILVFNFGIEDNLKRVVLGESVGTKVQG